MRALKIIAVVVVIFTSLVLYIRRSESEQDRAWREQHPCPTCGHEPVNQKWLESFDKRFGPSTTVCIGEISRCQTLSIGMSESEVWDLFGGPSRTDKAVYGNVEVDYWIYNGRSDVMLRFEDARLTAVHK